MATSTASSLNNSYSKLSNSISRLSSGLRIETASDDAAGLAVREQMRTSISALAQAERNAQDGISLIQTADSSMSVINTKLTRMKELAEQSATGTYTDAQRLIINSEFASVAAEIDRIAAETNFNGIKLLDGNVSTAGSAAGAVNQGGWSNNNTWVAAEGLFTNASGWEETNGQVSAAEGYTGGIAVHFSTQYNRAEDYYFVRIGDMRTSSLFAGTGTSPTTQTNAASTVSVSTQVAAQRALEQIDTAIVRADNTRASLGATQNRLEATIEGITTESENLQASESRISDIDVASEMTEYVKEQILTQSATSMLAQANSLPQLALNLLQ